MNNMELPQNLDKILKPPNSEKRNKGFLDLFRSKYLRLVSICFLCIWFTMNLVYYGLILNMNAFGGNIYVNSVSELEGVQTRHGCGRRRRRMSTCRSFVVDDVVIVGTQPLGVSQYCFCFATVFATT